MKPRKSSAEREIAHMERARDVLQLVVTDLRKHKAVTPESVTLITTSLMTVAMLEHEIGRRVGRTLKAWERAREDDDA